MDDRYVRQRQYPPIGREGQKRIESSIVAIVGVGALGTVAAEMMARAGVGGMKLIDRDVVQISNLQRQVMFDEFDARDEVAKADAAARYLRRVRSDLDVEPIVADLSCENIHSNLDGVDLVIDGSDNFAVRFLMNDWSLSTRTPLVHGGAVGGGGQVKLFSGEGRPCFRCLVPTPPPPEAIATCDTAGVIAPATHTVASIQCAEALKWLSGNRRAVCKDVICVDIWSTKFRRIDGLSMLSPGCEACVGGNFEFLSGRVEGQRGQTVCGRDSVQLPPRGTIDLVKLAERFGNVGETTSNRFFVRLQVNDRHRLTVFGDGRSIVDGTDDLSVARSIVDRFLGG